MTLLPEWFHIVKMHGMGPADLTAIYERMDRESAERGDTVVREVIETERSQVATNLDDQEAA